jgi:hypothetical protein
MHLLLSFFFFLLLFLHRGGGGYVRPHFNSLQRHRSGPVLAADHMTRHHTTRT